MFEDDLCCGAGGRSVTGVAASRALGRSVAAPRPQTWRHTAWPRPTAAPRRLGRPPRVSRATVAINISPSYTLHPLQPPPLRRLAFCGSNTSFTPYHHSIPAFTTWGYTPPNSFPPIIFVRVGFWVEYLIRTYIQYFLLRPYIRVVLCFILTKWNAHVCCL